MPPKPKDPILDPATTPPAMGTAGAPAGAMGTAGAPTGAMGADTLAVAAGGDLTLTANPAGTMDPDGRFTIIVQGPPAGRWRAGRHFTAEPTSIPAGDLTMQQLAALRDDPVLMVSAVEAPY